MYSISLTIFSSVQPCERKYWIKRKISPPVISSISFYLPFLFFTACAASTLPDSPKLVPFSGASRGFVSLGSVVRWDCSASDRLKITKLRHGSRSKIYSFRTKSALADFLLRLRRGIVIQRQAKEEGTIPPYVLRSKVKHKRGKTPFEFSPYKIDRFPRGLIVSGLARNQPLCGVSAFLAFISWLTRFLGSTRYELQRFQTFNFYR